MPDTFASHSAGLESPAENLAAVTPNDSTDLAFSSRALLVGGSGTLRVTTVGGQTVTLPATVVTAGVQLSLRVKRVHSTGTTATDIYAVW